MKTPTRTHRISASARPGAAMLLLTLLATSGLDAATRSSSNYTLTAETMDGGGSAASSAHYSLELGSLEPGAIETSSSSNYSSQHGFVTTTQVVVVAVNVEGRWVFYNDSSWDGRDAAANVSDDGAIATDKSALLAGQLATFANYTSYRSGINGIMIDIANLAGTPSASDFTFKVGNDQNPDGWADAAAPASVTVRSGAGVGGSDRITIIWENNAIEKLWLQVTVLPTANTGLAVPDVFCFGNAIGDVGNFANNAVVNIYDEAKVRGNPRSSANLGPITDVYDINRDKVVNIVDESLVRANGTTSSTMLVMLDLTSSAGATGSVSRTGALLQSVEVARVARSLDRSNAALNRETALSAELRDQLATADSNLAHSTMQLFRLSDGQRLLVLHVARGAELLTSTDMFRWNAMPLGTDESSDAWRLSEEQVVVRMREEIRFFRVSTGN